MFCFAIVTLNHSLNLKDRKHWQIVSDLNILHPSDSLNTVCFQVSMRAGLLITVLCRCKKAFLRFNGHVLANS